MSGLESTRVFGVRSTRVLGLRRRPLADLYHTLVTGSWTRLLVVYTAVWFVTQAMFGLAHLLLAAKGVESGALLSSLVAALESPPAPAPPLSLAWLLNGALSRLETFSRWLLLAIGAGIIFSKFSLPRARILWSRYAVVCPYADGRALQFRMANERTSHLLQAKIAAMVIWDERDDGGNVVRRAHDLELARGGSALFTHAWTAAHPLDDASPLRNETEATLAAREAEVVVTLTGYDGARFLEVVKTLENGARVIDYRRFDEVVPVEGGDDLLPYQHRRPREG
jgi:inward rectifier potassium channel